QGSRRQARTGRQSGAQLARSARNRLNKPLRVADPLEDRDLVDLWWLEMVPKDAGRPAVDPLDLDHRAWRRDQIDGQVMVGDHQMLAQDLDRVDGGRHAGAIVDLALLDEEPVLEVGEPAALAEPRPAEVHGD